MDIQSESPSAPVLSASQAALATNPSSAAVFLQGPAGCGKTTAAAARLRWWLDQGVSPGQVLVLLPTLALAEPFTAAASSNQEAGEPLTVLTLAGLAQSALEQFWPQVAEAAGFANPSQPPTFISYEIAQYFLGRLVEPMLRQGAFNSVTLEPHRIYSQVLDNLSQAASNLIPHTEIGERLISAWQGAPGQLSVYDDVQVAIQRFRQFCLERSLLDYSLQIETFMHHVWPLPECRRWLFEAYPYLIVDNVEENPPVLHDLLYDWLLADGALRGALLVYDWDAGYRRLLGADPDTAYELKELCPQSLTFEQSFVSPPALVALEKDLAQALVVPAAVPPEPADAPAQESSVLQVSAHRFYPEMLDWAAETVDDLVRNQGVSPSQIAILAPGLSDALRFSLAGRLERYGLQAHWERPSRALRDEPVSQCLLTLAALAYPAWAAPGGPLAPLARADVTNALVQAIPGLDQLRAGLLVEIVLRQRAGMPYLSAFETIAPDVQERIGWSAGERYEQLRLWLEAAYAAGEPLHRFLTRLFDEVLSQPGFGFHNDPKAAEVTANLLDSARQFDAAAGPLLSGEGQDPDYAYAGVVRDGLLSGQYLRVWQPAPAESVQLSAAYTFLLANRPVDYQIWLDVASYGWFDRLYQPLAQPYVLSRRWPPGRTWTDQDEYETSLASLYRLTTGLLRRCRRQVFLGYSDLGEQGYEQRGPLWRAVQALTAAS